MKPAKDIEKIFPGHPSLESTKHATQAIRAQRDFSHPTIRMAADLDRCIDLIENGWSTLSLEEKEVIEMSYHNGRHALWSKHAFKRFEDKDCQNMYEIVRSIIQKELFATYGDELALIVDITRGFAKQTKISGYRKLNKRADELTKDLESERLKYDRYLAGVNIPPDNEIKSSLCLGEVCRKLGLEFVTTRRIIRAYAERNGQVHNNITAMIEYENFGQLANKLYEN